MLRMPTGRGLLLLLVCTRAFADVAAPPAPASDTQLVEGPFKSIKGMCKTLAKDQTRYEFHADTSLSSVAACIKCVFACNSDTQLWQRDSGLPKPIDEVVFFVSTATTEDSGYNNHTTGSERIQGTLNVAIRVGKNWFLVADVDSGLGMNPITINAAKIQPMGVGGTPLLIVRYTVDQSNSNQNRADHQSIFAIGVGPKGEPGATKPVEIMNHTDDTAYGAEAQESSSKMTVNYHIEAGAIVIENSTVVEKDEGKTTRKRDKTPKRYSLALP
jgi:hypothetical protein